MSKRGIQYVSQDEPSFIKQFKMKVGYKESATVDTKREALERDEGDGEDLEDEAPTVVQLKKGDISQEEYDRLMKGQSSVDKDSKEKEDDAELEEPSDGKIKFKKPANKSKQSDLNVSTKKKQDSSETKSSETKSSETKSSDTKSSDKKDKKSKKAVKNKQLLSFNDEEEED